MNEAFASVPLAWAKSLGADLNKLNVNGGAMALGHPLVWHETRLTRARPGAHSNIRLPLQGATGTKLTTTLLHELERRKARYGVIAICEGGGTANATLIERIDSAKL